MPATLATPSNSAVKVRFQETYVSEGLNKKLFGVVPSGIVRGGRLETAGSGFVVNVVPDSATNDSIYTYGDRVGNHQLTFRDSGVRPLNLAAHAGTTVYIALFIDYSVSGPTAVQWRAYTEAELFGGAPVSEAGSVVIVGKAVVPLVGPIPFGNVTPERARFAWTDQSAGTRPWKQVVENGSFDAGIDSLGTGHSVPHWTVATTAGAPIFSATTTNPRMGTRSLQWTGSGFDSSYAGPVPSVPGNVLTHPLIPTHAGQLIHASFWVAGTTIPAYTQGIGGVALVATFYDEAGVVLGTARVETDPADEVGTFGYRQIDGITRAGDGFVSWHLEFALDLAGGPGSFFVDDVRVFLQSYGDRALEDQGEVGATVDQSLVSGLLSLIPRAGATSVGDKHGKRLDMSTFPLGGIPHLALLAADGATHAPVVGPLFSNDPFDPETARFGTADFGDHVLVWESNIGVAPTRKMRIYSRGVASSGGFEFTVNARYDDGTSAWVPDDAATDAYRASLKMNSALTLETRRTPTGASWADNGWSATLLSTNKGSTNSVLFADGSTAPGQWYRIIDFPTGNGDRRARLYVGTGGPSTQAGVALTVNAFWNGATWEADSPSATSPALRLLVVRSGTEAHFLFQGKTDTSVAWAELSWGSNMSLANNDLSVGDDIAAGGSVTAGDRVIAENDIRSINGNIRTLNGNFIADGDYRYDNAQQITQAVNIAHGIPGSDGVGNNDWAANGSFFVSSGFWVSIVDNAPIDIPLPLPHGVELNRVRVRVKEGTGGGHGAVGDRITLTVRKMVLGVDTGGSVVNLGDDSSSGSGNIILSVGGLSDTVDLFNNELFVAHIEASGDAAANADYIIAAEVRYTYQEVRPEFA